MATRVREVLLKIHSTLQAPTEVLGRVAVYCGPVITGSGTDAIFLGYDGDPDGDYVTATATSEWAGIGTKRRNESIDIVGAVIVTTGSTDPVKAWERVFDIYDAMEDTLRANVSQDFPPPTVIEINSTSLFTEQVQGGLQIRLPFTISVRTRI